MLLQAIVIDDALYEARRTAKTFANTHDLPRRLPAVRAADHRADRERDGHAPGVVRRHHRRLRAHPARSGASASTPPSPELEPKGYDRRFQRLWNIYLAFSEAGFRERRIRDLQLLVREAGRDARPERRGCGRAGPRLTMRLHHVRAGGRAAARPRPRPRRQPRQLGAGDRPGGGRARRDRRRHAGLRRLGPPPGGTEHTPAAMGAGDHGPLASLGHRASAPGGQLTRRVGGARDGGRRKCSLGLRDLAGRAVAQAARAPRSFDARARGKRLRAARARRASHAARAASADAHDRRPPGVADGRRGRALGLGLARRARLRGREPDDAHAHLRPRRPRSSAGDDRVGQRRPPGRAAAAGADAAADPLPRRRGLGPHADAGRPRGRRPAPDRGERRRASGAGGD